MKEQCSGGKWILSLSRAGTVVLSALAVSLLFAGCAEHPGIVAYRQGDYDATLREFRAGDDPVGDFVIGMMHYKGEGVPCDPRQAAVWFQRAAALGHAGAEYNLGLLYLN